jgi:NitT/TauT family transport system substrate-binding protein
VIDEGRMGPYAHWLAENGAIPDDRDWAKSFTNGLLDVAT